MRHRNHPQGNADPALARLAALVPRYRDELVLVDAAGTRLADLIERPHLPVDLRAAADELTAALGAATATAVETLRLLQMTAPPARRRRRRGAAHPDPVAVRRWSAELTWLAEIGVWARRTAKDDLGARLPTAVRVANRGAYGPHIPGMGTERADVVPPAGRGIGVDLRAAIDGAGHPRPALAAPAPVVERVLAA